MSIIAAVQFSSQSTVEENLKQIEKDIIQAVSDGAKCVVFPEESITLRMSPAEKLKIAEPFENGPIQNAFRELALRHKVWIVGGTLPIQSEDKDRFYSSSIIWDDEGKCVARYNKIHLFDVMVNKEESYCESAHVKAGKDVVVVSTPFGKMGMAICYDVRFPELFRCFMLEGVDIILLPSAFTQPTGKAHWEMLVRARAVENQCYVIAPNQVGERLSGHGTYGHSMIVDPWGEILAQRDIGAGIITANIDLDKMDNIRERFPAIKHYRSFLIKRK